ncbi:MAG: DUF302 domain-containing protein [Burkholderiales bacterium]
MKIRNLAAVALVAAGVAASGAASAQGSDGVVRVKSAYPMDETIARIKDDIAKKGIMFFSAVDQQSLAAKAGIELPPSTLLMFGNPALGSQFITAKGDAGLDWPVRLLVQQDEQGNVWAVYTDFGYIAQRHHITSRDPQFAMANNVVQSITSTVKAVQ